MVKPTIKRSPSRMLSPAKAVPSILKYLRATLSWSELGCGAVRVIPAVCCIKYSGPVDLVSILAPELSSANDNSAAKMPPVLKGCGLPLSTSVPSSCPLLALSALASRTKPTRSCVDIYGFSRTRYVTSNSRASRSGGAIFASITSANDSAWSRKMLP